MIGLAIFGVGFFAGATAIVLWLRSSGDRPHDLYGEHSDCLFIGGGADKFHGELR